MAFDVLNGLLQAGEGFFFSEEFDGFTKAGAYGFAGEGEALLTKQFNEH